MPRHRLLSAHEATLPCGCWTVFAVVSSELSGLKTFSVMAEAMWVDFPTERLRFASDSEYQYFVLNNELTSEEAYSISVVASTVRDLLAVDEAVLDQSEVSRLIRAVRDVITQQGPSRDVYENQQLFSVASTAWHRYRRQMLNLTNDGLSEIVQPVKGSRTAHCRRYR